MRLIIIFLLFSFSMFGQSGIEPSSFQGTPYEGGILVGVTPIVDEFTGDTIYLYQHSDTSFVKIDSLVYTDSLRLYTSQGVFTTYIASGGGGGGSGTVTSIATTLPITGGTITTTGTIGINTANGSQSGAISSTDWTTFNNKIGGTGTDNYYPYFNSSNTLANSELIRNSSTLTTLSGARFAITFPTTVSNLVIGDGANNSQTGSGNLIFGYNSPGASLTTGFANVLLGAFAGNSITSGSSNLLIGNGSGRYISGTSSSGIGIGTETLSYASGNNNIGIGDASSYFAPGSTIGIGRLACFGQSGATGSYNIGIGEEANYSYTTGSQNVSIGRTSGKEITIGAQNVGYGNFSNRLLTTGTGNVSLGYQSGYSNSTGNYNVNLGYQAGYNETGGNKLYIANSSTTTPLIGGNFSTSRLGINKDISTLSTTLHVGGDLTIDTRTGTATSMTGFDTNGKVVTLGLGAGLSITGGDLISTATGITSLGGETGATQTFATGTTGTDFNISSASNVHTFNLPTASSVNTGKLSSADWITFNNKGNGTVTNFSAGDLSPLFITTEATTTTTPALSFLPVSQTANLFYASPNGSSGNPTFRSIVAADVPTLNQNTTGSAATLTTGRTISMTGDVSYTSGSFNGSANVTGTGTLATVNANVGTFTNATVTVNAKGLITAASSGSGSGITSLGGETGATQTFATANTGTYPSWSSASNVHTYRLPSASTGQVLKYDGTGWAAGTDNSGITGGNTNRIPYWTSSTAQSFTNFTWEAGLPGMQVPTGNSIWFSGTATIIDKNNDGGVADQVLTRAASGGGMDWRSIADLGAGGTNLSYSVKSGTDVTLESSTGVDVILRDGVGTNVNRVASNVVKIDADDPSIANEGYIGVTAGSSTSSVIQGYNSSGTATGAGMTLNGNFMQYLTETTSTNGGSITMNAAAPYTLMTNGTTLYSLTTSYAKISMNGASGTNGDGLYIDYDDANDEIDILVTGTYKISYTCNCKSNTAAHLVTFDVLNTSTLTSQSVITNHYFNNTNEYCSSNSFYIRSLTSGTSYGLYAKTDTGTPNINDCRIRFMIERLK